MARSSWIALGIALCCGGCDLAFGFDTDESPCDVKSFDGARHTDITDAVLFSVNWDQDRAVVLGDDGFNYEVALPSGDKKMIDLGGYNIVNMSLVPEGNAVLYTVSVEPMELHGALRNTDGTWQLAATVPRGTFAGTPSADVFGPRRLLVLMRSTDTALQEYEDQSGHWVTIGEPHPYDSQIPPNLTPNGLTAVFSRPMLDGTYETFAMTRASTAEWFGEPVKILAAGADSRPQLLGNCKKLYTTHDTQLRRYDQ